MASRLTTFSSGWPSSNFLIGSSCFLPDSVRGISATCLSDLAPWMQSAEPDRQYRLRMRKGFHPAVYMQGYSEPTHGLSDTLLSVLAVRAQEIATSAEQVQAARLIAAE